ncbi:MAG: hypothetical protein E7074_03230 [Bacteroidales bacterium]|nr:hypothetical protein [Bacteroidales bacterium]
MKHTAKCFKARLVRYHYRGCWQELCNGKFGLRLSAKVARIADSQTNRKKGRRPKAGFGFDVAVGGVGYKSTKRPNRKRWKITVNQCVTMRFGLAVWLIGFVPLAEWRKAGMLKLPVFTGAPEDSVIHHSANKDLTSVTVICRSDVSCKLIVNDLDPCG